MDRQYLTVFSLYLRSIRVSFQRQYNFWRESKTKIRTREISYGFGGSGLSLLVMLNVLEVPRREFDSVSGH